MKLARLKLIVALSLLLLSMATITAQDSIPKEFMNKPVKAVKNSKKVKKPSLSTNVSFEDTASVAHVFDQKLVKYDSLLNEREKNIQNFKSENDKLAKVNQRSERALSRFPNDSISKYENEVGEMIDADTLNTTTSEPQIEIPVAKKSIWRKLNPFHKK